VAKGGGAAAEAGAGAGAVDGKAKPDDPVVTDPEPPVTVPFDMKGEAHTLVADPSKDKIEFNSVPGELLKKILSILGLVKGDAAADVGAAGEKSKDAEATNKSADLKPGAKKSLRVVAAQKLKVALAAVKATLHSLAVKAGIVDATPEAVKHAEDEKKEKDKGKDGDPAKKDKAEAVDPSAKVDAKPGAGGKVDAPADPAAKIDGKAPPADGKADAKADAKETKADASGKVAPNGAPDPSKPTPKPEHKPFDVKRSVTLGSNVYTLHVSGDVNQVMVDELGMSLPDAIAKIETAVGPDARKALGNAARFANGIASSLQGPPELVGNDDAKANKTGVNLDSIVSSLSASKVLGLTMQAIQSKPNPAITNNAEAMDAFYKHRSWEELKKLYWEADPRDEASMWQLFHARKAWVDQRINTICDKNQCDKQDFGSAKATSDYDISVKVRAGAVPKSLQAQRPRQGDKAPPPSGDAPAATSAASGIAPGGPPEKQQLDAEVQKAAQAAAKKNASIDPAPPAAADTPGVNKVISKFNEEVAAEFGVQPGVVFDTNVYDGGETVPAALNEAPGLQTDAAKEADLQVQDAAAMSKVRRYLTDDGDNAQSDYTSKTFNDYKNALLKSLGAGAAKDKLRQALTDGEQMYRDYRREFDKELKQIETDDAKNGKIGVTTKNAEPVDPALAKKDQEMRASNKVYAARIAKVDALRTRREEIVTAVRESKEKLPTDAQKAALDELTNQIRAQQALALQAASEAYNSEGAMVDVVVNQQMFKKDDSQKIVTTLNEKLQSVNEQFGDVFKELAHGATAAVAAAKASKYAYRFARMADEAIKALPENLRPKTSAQTVDTLLKFNAEDGALQNIRQSATPKKAQAVFDKAGLVPEGYKAMFMPVNIELNAALRAAIELEQSKAKNGGGGAAPPTV
jgi:hypothetical protein